MSSQPSPCRSPGSWLQLTEPIRPIRRAYQKCLAFDDSTYTHTPTLQLTLPPQDNSKALYHRTSSASSASRLVSIAPRATPPQLHNHGKHPKIVNHRDRRPRTHMPGRQGYIKPLTRQSTWCGSCGHRDLSYTHLSDFVSAQYIPHLVQYAAQIIWARRRSLPLLLCTACISPGTVRADMAPVHTCKRPGFHTTGPDSEAEPFLRAVTWPHVLKPLFSFSSASAAQVSRQSTQSLDGQSGMGSRPPKGHMFPPGLRLGGGLYTFSPIGLVSNEAVSLPLFRARLTTNTDPCSSI